MVDEEKDLLAREREWVNAHLDMDLPAIEDILDEEFAQLKPGGTIIGRSELIESYKSGDRYWEIAQSEPVRVQIWGDTGLLFGKWRGKGVNSGQPFDYSAIFLAVYRRRDGRWHLAAEASLDQTS
jgi:ketosteroid isomerase-like protein